MRSEKIQRKKVKSATGLALGLASLAAGAYHGYCDAQGIPFKKEILEPALTYGPAIVHGVVCATTKSLVNLPSVVYPSGDAPFGREYLERRLERDLRNAGGEKFALATSYGIIGLGMGGMQTLIGYGIGYLAGYATK